MLTTTEGTKTKKLSVSYADSIKNTKMQPTTVYDVIDTIKNDADLAKMVAQLRNENDSTKKANLKNNLPYFNLGLFEDGERKNDKLISTEFMVVDVDKLGESELTTLRNNLFESPKIYSYFTSPSGNGLKVILHFAEVVTESKLFTENYKFYADWCLM